VDYKNYRRYGRVTVPEDKLMPCEGTSKPLRGKVSILGLGGMFIRTPDVFPAGTVIGVRFQMGELLVETDCAVRYASPNGMGVEFVKLRGSNSENLQKILSKLKMSEATQVQV